MGEEQQRQWHRAPRKRRHRTPPHAKAVAPCTKKAEASYSASTRAPRLLEGASPLAVHQESGGIVLRLHARASSLGGGLAARQRADELHRLALRRVARDSQRAGAREEADGGCDVPAEGEAARQRARHEGGADQRVGEEDEVARLLVARARRLDPQRRAAVAAEVAHRGADGVGVGGEHEALGHQAERRHFGRGDRRGEERVGAAEEPRVERDARGDDGRALLGGERGRGLEHRSSAKAVADERDGAVPREREVLRL
eukprot:CAMPEP_0184403094 /NCGR_PEP_ID=MMETSP0007-20130409/85223_1 /TAXON_ID=97485 /ORGANISM="Prymnesium parvum, Strain Texoma1" /LENGTH=256 /DNA_ID=CAMNT_0026759159 /DNA_START=300 /DNA_END=1067 /DNA_ORIENTATION=+